MIRITAILGFSYQHSAGFRRLQHFAIRGQQNRMQIKCIHSECERTRHHLVFEHQAPDQFLSVDAASALLYVQ